MSEHLLEQLALVIVLGITAQWLAWRIRLPSILLLLTFGFIAGPITGILQVDTVLGDLLFPLVSVSVGIILFEGGLALKFRDLRETGRVIRNLISIGALVTWGLTSLGAYLLLGLNPALAVQLGAVLVVTGPTVIGPLLRFVRPVGNVASILRWEGILIDPVGATLAVLVFNAILIGDLENALTPTIVTLVLTIIVGSLTGFLGARLLVFLMRRHLIPDHLQNPLTFMLVIGVFAASEVIQHESGLLATTVMGIALANQRHVTIRRIVEFKENIGVLLISSLFIILSARLNTATLAALDWRIVLFIAFMILIVRPLSVVVSSYRSRLSWKERAFIAWMAPRGIVAASVTSIFSLRLAEVGHPQADLLVPITFAVIVATCALYGLTALPLARWLGLTPTDVKGVLLIGAHSWARELAAALDKANQKVLLIDTNFDNVQAARLMHLNAHYGSAISEVDEDLKLDGIGRVLALTANDEVNSLSALHFSETFGRAETYQLPVKKEDHVSRELRGRFLFNRDATFARLNDWFEQGAVIRATPLTKTFTYQDYRTMYGDAAIPLFLIDTATGRLLLFTVDAPLIPQPGHTVIALVNLAESPNEVVRQKAEVLG
ncbi:MAG: sodium:proton antiporter [Anaerolinea sp.]|nr:sodium:proton antiporter [Anaerolinea sp.]